MLETNVLEKAKKIRLLISDVDGVLTNGQIYFGPAGETIKAFHIHDGLGIKLLRQAGIEFAIITAKKTAMVQERFEQLGVKYIFQGCENKFPVVQQLAETLKISLQEIAYVGDDLPDLLSIKQVGLGIAVPNAVTFVKENADYQTKCKGGKGAIREICEFILSAQEKLTSIYQQYS